MDTQPKLREVSEGDEVKLGFSPEGQLRFTHTSDGTAIAMRSGQRIAITNIPLSFQETQSIHNGVVGTFIGGELLPGGQDSKDSHLTLDYIEGSKSVEDLNLAQSPIVLCKHRKIDLFQLASMAINDRIVITVKESLSSEELKNLIAEMSNRAHTC